MAVGFCLSAQKMLLNDMHHPWNIYTYMGTYMLRWNINNSGGCLAASVLYLIKCFDCNIWSSLSPLIFPSESTSFVLWR